MFSVEFIKKEWEKLKDNYRKCLQRRERMLKSGSGSKKLPVCNFFKELSFLKDSNASRKTASNVSFNVATDNSTSQDFTTDATTTTTTTSTSAPPQKTGKRKHVASEIELGIDAMIVKALAGDKEETQKVGDSDEDQLFCLSLVSMLKSLPTKKKRYARMKIEELFYELSDDV